MCGSSIVDLSLARSTQKTLIQRKRVARIVSPQTRDRGATSSVPFTVHVDAVPALRERARRATGSRELVVTTVQAHRRNLRDRLREHDCPQTNFEFERLLEVARRVTGSRGGQTEVLDRIDRLWHLEAVLEDARDAEDVWYTDLAVSTGTGLPERPEVVEAIRSEIETVTGFHPGRLDALRTTADEVSSPTDSDTHARIEAALAVQRTLTRRVEPAPTPDTVIRAATRTLAAEGDAAWQAAYESVDRITVAGTASLPATLADFLHVLGAETTVDVHLYLRAATGSTIRDRLPTACAVDDPGHEVIES